MCESNVQKVTGGWEELDIEELHNFTITNHTKVIKLRNMAR